ncbi:MAG: hypothetical protein RLZZ502_607 [Pseudomonadota bacterium]
MQMQRLPHAGFDVSLICLGTMTWGEQNTEAEAHAQLDWALDNDINFIDTAEMYPVPPRGPTQGRTEQYIGTWYAKSSSKRAKTVLATKVAGPARERDWIRNGDTSLTKKNIKWACEDSLKRLQTEVIDLYQIHWPERNVAAFGTWQFDVTRERPSTPMEEQVEAMAELIKEGKIRAWGVSNETSWGVQKFCHIAERMGVAKPASIQNPYHLLNRLFEADLAETSYREQVPLLAYSPLAMGVLSGKYLKDPKASGRLTVFENFGDRYKRPIVVDAVRAYDACAKRHGLTLMELSLSYLASKPFMGAIIIGATSVAQCEEQIKAYQKPMSKELLKDLEATALCFSHPCA